MRTAPKIAVKPEDLKILMKRANSRTEPLHVVERAKIIMLCNEGKSVNAVAAEMGTYPNKIIEY